MAAIATVKKNTSNLTNQMDHEARKLAMNKGQQGTRSFEEKQLLARAFDGRCVLAWLARSIFLIVFISLACRSFNRFSAVFLLLLRWVLLSAGGIFTTALWLSAFFA